MNVLYMMTRRRRHQCDWPT